VCTAALNTFQRLAEIAVGENEENPRIRAPTPPMVTLTFCGKYVRFWIAYRVEDGNLCVRIWSIEEVGLCANDSV
jgi:hypothetical protein